ncbi:MAG: transglutaminase family protein, partial [Lautropia sp.]|nr:transglutaminase family protein [Lautropia sp.]
MAARFVSGYLIQLKADVAPLEGPAGPADDFTDLHAWAEVYIPGAGWIGLDPTSGLLTGEGHIPLACSALPASAAPVTGMADPAQVQFHHEMRVSRLREDPRVTKPYGESDWEAIDALGRAVDEQLLRDDVRLTQGGEPTFVSIDDMEGEEWNTAALGERKRELAGQLVERLQRRFTRDSLLHHGQGKWYPGEPLPRWALNLFWRTDGQPIWRDPALLAGESGSAGCSQGEAHRFALTLTGALGLDRNYLMPAYEEVIGRLLDEQRLPINAEASNYDLKDPAQRRQLALLLQQDLVAVAGYVLPLKALPPPAGAAADSPRWLSGRWPLRRGRLFLVEGSSPLGLRLPLVSLPWRLPAEIEPEFPADPFEARLSLDAPPAVGAVDVTVIAPAVMAPASKSDAAVPAELAESAEAARVQAEEALAETSARDVIHTALCVQVRDGLLHVFLPPLARLEDALWLLATIEACAAATGSKVRLEGYPPPRDPRLRMLSVTPDPGVIEVNIHPASRWPELVDNVTALYEEARLCRLGTEKFMLDGRHTGTGGGNHVTLGGPTAADSPMLRRPDLLRSLVTYWQNHPSLSYLFSGAFIGPTSQAPRVDEARDDTLYELAIAFQQMEKALPKASESKRPWLVDRLLRNLLVDLTGNTHRAEFSIDKLYSPDGPTG